MPPPVSVRKAVRCLQRKGFRIDNRDRRRYVHYDSEGKKTGAYVYFSHGGTASGEVGPSLLQRMKRELQLGTIQEVRALLTCTMEEEEFLRRRTPFRS